MPKLRLKRTPEEEAARRERKRKKREAKIRGDSTERPRKRATSNDAHIEDKLSSSFGSLRHPPHVKPDADFIRTEIEDAQFREKLFGALGDDERLDSIEACFNDFAHVPRRWRNLGSSAPSFDDRCDTDEFLRRNPQNMDDEEYAEWVRIGMYRKKHKDEYIEEQRQNADKSERRAQEQARKLETRRLEKLAEETRKQKKLEREQKRRRHAKEVYEDRWLVLLSQSTDIEESGQQLKFQDIPWPTVVAHSRGPGNQVEHIVSMEDLTPGAIEDFFFAAPYSVDKERKDILRETLLRFHPDKFEGRIMKYVKVTERNAVREGISQVVRSVNTLMTDNTTS